MMDPKSPVILPYGNVAPRFAGALVRCGEGAAVLGRVTVGKGARLGALSVIRADGHEISIGDDFHLGPRSTLHIAHEQYPTRVGDRVTVGAFACVHACTVGSDCVLEDDAVILDGAVVEDEVILERGAVVFPRARIVRGHVYAGCPAKAVRPVAPGEIVERGERVARACQVSDARVDRAAMAGSDRTAESDPSVFVAGTAAIRGRLRGAAGSSVWFSCDFDAGSGAISVGKNTNIQDNTIIRCTGARDVTIGRDSTIGHNARLGDCAIGDGSLIGIGATVAPGTIIGDRVLLAAGARTLPGQVLEGGWVWTGNPARQRAPMDEAKREMTAFIIGTYCQYARDFKACQNEHGNG